MSLERVGSPGSALDIVVKMRRRKSLRVNNIPYHLTPMDSLTREERDELYKHIVAPGENCRLKGKSLINLLKYIEHLPGETPMEKDMLLQLVKKKLVGKLVLGIHDGGWYRIKQFVDRTPFHLDFEKRTGTLWNKIRFWKSKSVATGIEKSLAGFFFFKYSIRIDNFHCILGVEPIDDSGGVPNNSEEVQLPLDVCYICC